jgi:hypothetical protein
MSIHGGPPSAIDRVVFRLDVDPWPLPNRPSELNPAASARDFPPDAQRFNTIMRTGCEGGKNQMARVPLNTQATELVIREPSEKELYCEVRGNRLEGAYQFYIRD